MLPSASGKWGAIPPGGMSYDRWLQCGERHLSSQETSFPCPAGTGIPVSKCCRDLGRKLTEVARALSGGQYHAARNLAVALNGKYPSRACVMYLLWRAHEMCGEEAEASRYRETLAAMEPRWPAVFWAQMVSQVRKEDLPRALLAYVDLCEKLPDSPRGSLAGLFSHALAGLASRSLDVFEVAWILRSAAELLVPEARQKLHQILERNGHLLAVGPGGLLRPRKVGRALPQWLRPLPQLVRQGRLITALETGHRWRRENPADFAAWWNTLALQLWLWRPEEARQTLEEMASAGFSDEEQGEAWAAFFCYVGPWLEQLKTQPTWQMEISPEALETLAGHPAVDILAPQGVPASQLKNLQFALLGWFEPIPGLEPADAAVRAEAWKAAGLVRRRQEGDLEVLWTGLESEDRLKQFLRGTLRAEPSAWRHIDPMQRPRELAQICEVLAGRLIPVSLRGPWQAEDQTTAACVLRRGIIRYVETSFLSSPRPELDSKTPLEAAADPQLRARLIGLLLSLLGEYPSLFPVLHAVRERLNLGSPQLIDARALHPRRVPFVALLRVDPATVNGRFFSYLVRQGKSALHQLAVMVLWRFVAGNPRLRHLLSDSEELQLARKRLLLTNSVQEAEEILRLISEPKEVKCDGLPAAELLRLAFFGLWGSREEFAERFWQLRGRYWSNPTVRTELLLTLAELGFLRPPGILLEWLRRGSAAKGAWAQGHGCSDSRQPATTGSPLEELAAKPGADPSIKSPSPEPSSKEGRPKLWLPGDPL